MTNKMSHKIIPITEPVKRKYRKGSIYDPVINEFAESNISLGKIEMFKKDGVQLEGTYLTAQLKKRLKQRKADPIKEDEKLHLETVEAKTMNSESYLSRETE